MKEKQITFNPEQFILQGKRLVIKTKYKKTKDMVIHYPSDVKIDGKAIGDIITHLQITVDPISGITFDMRILP